MSREAAQVLVVGNPCHDTLLGPRAALGAHQTLGGGVAYACATLRALDVPFRAVSNVGPDFLYAGELLAQPTMVAGTRTTSFLDAVVDGARHQTLLARGAAIAPSDLAGVTRVRVAIAAGVAGEVLPETLLELRERCELLLADAQGLVRSFGPGGEVGQEPLAATAFAPLLDRLDYIKASESEARALDLPALRRLTTVLLTEGARGCRVLTARDDLHVPGFPAGERDPTGAGDAFLAGFAAGRLRGLGDAEAARLGNFCGARTVEHLGVPRFASGELSRALAAAGFRTAS